MVEQVREAGRIDNVAVVIATGVNNDAHSEVLGFNVITTEERCGLVSVPAWLGALAGTWPW